VFALLTGSFAIAEPGTGMQRCSDHLRRSFTRRGGPTRSAFPDAARPRPPDKDRFRRRTGSSTFTTSSPAAARKAAPSSRSYQSRAASAAAASAELTEARRSPDARQRGELEHVSVRSAASSVAKLRAEAGACSRRAMRPPLGAHHPALKSKSPPDAGLSLERRVLPHRISAAVLA